MGLGLDCLVTSMVQVTTMRLGDGQDESKRLSHILMALCVFGMWMMCFWYGLIDFSKNYRLRGRRHDIPQRAREVGILIVVLALVLSIIQLFRVIKNETIYINGYLLSHQKLQMLVGVILASMYTGALKSRWLYTLKALKDLRRSLSEEMPLLPILTSPSPSTPPAPILTSPSPSTQPAPILNSPSQILTSPSPSTPPAPSYGPIRFGKKWRGDVQHPYFRHRPLLASSQEEHPPTPSTTCYNFPTPAWFEKVP